MDKKPTTKPIYGKPVPMPKPVSIQPVGKPLPKPMTKPIYGKPGTVTMQPVGNPVIAKKQAALANMRKKRGM